jgi:hypothetical protein
MPPLPKDIEFAERLEIHHDRLIAKLSPMVEKLKATKTRKNSHLVGPQIDYWDRVISGLKWSTAIAKQRAGLK